MNHYYKCEESYAGFCAILNNTINVCSSYEQIFPEGRLFIESPQLEDIFDFEKKPDFSENFEPFWRTSNFDNSCNAHTLCDEEKIKAKNAVFKRFFPIKNNNFYESESIITSRTLGIQIRGTDKKTEIIPPTDENIIRHIRLMMEKHDIDRIFLATDDAKYKNLIIEEFGNMVVFKENTISIDGNPIHFADDRTSINREVMSDVCILSKCPYMLYCFSNVSHLALILGIQNFSDYDCINREL